MQSRLDSDVFNSLVKSSVSDANIMEVKALFLPVHMDQHLGLAVFWIEEQTIRFDDGHHFPIPRQLKTRAKKILECIHSITGSIRFQPDKLNYKRFKDPETRKWKLWDWGNNVHQRFHHWITFHLELQ
jgi:hypothetical protein